MIRLPRLSMLTMGPARASLLALATAAAVAGGCRRDTDAPDNEVEEITTVEITLTDSATGTQTGPFIYRDLDGPGGDAPNRIDTLRMIPGVTYRVQTAFFDDSKTPREDITTEIREEKNEHQVFLVPAGLTGVTARFDPADFDTNNPPKPVGLSQFVRVDQPGQGTIRVVLKHQPGSQKANITNPLGDINVGETDAEVTFPAVVR